MTLAYKIRLEGNCYLFDLASISPLLTSSLELLEHSLTHLDEGDPKDLRIAITDVDNAVELLLKEVSRFRGIRIIDKNGHSISYYSCIDELQKIGVHLPELPDIDILHAERNGIYHAGNQPSKETATWLVIDVSLTFIRRICHDELKYDIASFSREFDSTTHLNRNLVADREMIVRNYISKADFAYNQGRYNEALVAAYSGIEAYLGNAIPIDIRTNPNMLDQLVHDDLLPQETVDKILGLRSLRNSAVHQARTISKKDAKAALDTFKFVVDAINDMLQ